MPKLKPAPGGRHFPCAQCGALLLYAPGSHELECGYCGHRTPIEESALVIQEYAFREALARLARAGPADARPSTQCSNCAATFDFAEHVHAGECPFCGTQIVEGTGVHKHIKPESLLPFEVTDKEAQTAFKRWVGKLWFAPGKLKKYAREDSHLTGVYVPHWTYDSMTHSGYRGQRGNVYHVPQSYVTVENGRRVRRTRMVTKIRWTAVSGSVSRFFDDVLVGASRSLPRKITDKLKPWDLTNLTPYNEKFLSGFTSEIYQVDLDEGFNHAVEIMDQVIRGDIARDIGGDHQRIQAVDTRHSNTRFKHLLLPVWSSGFRFRGKTYRFVVNGRSGKVRGERPYSAVKIALAVIAAVTAVLLFVAFAEESGLLNEMLR